MRRFWSRSGLAAPGELQTLDDAESHHLLRVVGIAPGEQVELFDGCGRSVRARLLDVQAGRARLEVEARVPAMPPAPVWLLVGLTRGPAFDTVVRMGTELGVRAIWPIAADRSVALGDRRERWERIAVAAAGQSGRADVPEIRPPQGLEQALVSLPAEAERFFCVPGGPVFGRPDDEVAIAVGPEGGWTDEEIALARRMGCRLVGLGPGVLRADTAAVVALALIRSA